MHLSSLLFQLESNDLIHRDDSPDLSYLFKHALTQESAYESLLKSKRAELHRHVAESIERLAPDRLEQNAAVLALHFDRAKMDDKAFTYAALAGDLARRAYAHSEALAFYDRALDIGQRLEDARWIPRLREVYVNRGNVLEVQSSHAAAIENYQAMIDWAQRIGDLAIEADAANHLATIRVLMHSSAPETVQQLERALDLATQSGNQEMICRTLWNFGLAYRFEDPPRAAEYLDKALVMAREAKLDEMIAFALIDLMGTMRLKGSWKRGIEYGLEALERFRKLDSKPMIADVLGGLGAMWQIAGETAKSRQAAIEGVQICETIGNPWGYHVSRNNLVEIAFAHGEIMQTIVDGEALLAGGREIGFPLFVGLPLMLLSRANLELNQLDRALGLAQESAAALVPMKSIWINYSNGYLGRVHLRRGELDRAHQLLDPLMKIDAETDAQFYGFLTVALAIAELALVEQRFDEGLQYCDWFLERCAEEDLWGFGDEMLFMRARLYFAKNNLEWAESDLIRAREHLERAENNLLLWRVHALLAQVHKARSELAEASESGDSAKRLIAEIADKISDAILRDGFLSREDVKQAASY